VKEKHDDDQDNNDSRGSKGSSEQDTLPFDFCDGVECCVVELYLQSDAVQLATWEKPVQVYPIPI
jgi:hypothetical protein